MHCRNALWLNAAFNQSGLRHFYQSTLCHEQHEDVIPSFGVDSNEKFCLIYL